MQLTTAQKQAIKAWVISNANSVFEQVTANLLNAIASPDFLVWRQFVPMTEVMANGFDWTRVDNLTPGKARIWEWMERAYEQGGVGGLNPSKASCRSGINEVWKGTAPDLAVRAVVYSHMTQNATVLEKLFATGAGTAPDQDGNGPATRVISGAITLDDLIAAANS